MAASRVSGGAVPVLVMAGAIALIPPTLFPVLTQHGEALSLGYVTARILEVVLLLPAAVLPLLLVAVARRESDAGTPDGAAQVDTVRMLSQLQEA